MNRLVLVLFGVVLIVTLAVGGFYLFQNKSFSFSNLLPSSYVSLETAKQKAGKSCKNTGFNNTKDADSYFVSFTQKLGADKEIGADKVSGDIYIQKIDLGNTCWGVWAGDKNGNGTLFWEDIQGKTNQIKTNTQL